MLRAALRTPCLSASFRLHSSHELHRLHQFTGCNGSQLTHNPLGVTATLFILGAFQSHNALLGVCCGFPFYRHPTALLAHCHIHPAFISSFSLPYLPSPVAVLLVVPSNSPPSPQMEQKMVASEIFKDKKDNYPQSVAKLFVGTRLSECAHTCSPNGATPK